MMNYIMIHHRFLPPLPDPPPDLPCVENPLDDGVRVPPLKPRVDGVEGRTCVRGLGETGLTCGR